MNSGSTHREPLPDSSVLPGRKGFTRGIHPPQRKDFSADAAIEVVPTPQAVRIPLWQNIGGPCQPVVKPRQSVAFGELVAEGESVISSSLHTPVAGTVGRLTNITLPGGRRMQAMPIKAAGDQPDPKSLWARLRHGPWSVDEIDRRDPDEITLAIYHAGIVGLGGAAFPTHVKMRSYEERPVHTLVINGCECEPYLTADHRLMLEAPEAVVAGALLAARSLRAENIFIGVEDNKPEAIQALGRACSGTGIVVAPLKTKYPQGSEKHLIYGVTRRQVPLGGLPLDIGVAIGNVGTMAAVAQALFYGNTLTHRVVSVTGGGIAQPKNLYAPIGVSCGELIRLCGGLTPEAARMVAGGPMMGFAFTDLETPVTKGTSGLTILTKQDVRAVRETHCIRCGRCVDACPMGLVPTKLALAARNRNTSLLGRYHVTACFECGCCAYVCPAKLPIVQLIRAGKSMTAG